MFQGHRIGAVLLMGGFGIRFGGALPKQFRLLCGKPLYLHALETLVKTGLFDEIVLVCPAEWLEKMGQERDEGMTIVPGGATRQESSRAGLLGFREAPEIVLIHDGVRPFVTEGIVRGNLEAAVRWGATDTCIASADTLVHAPERAWIGSIPRREEFLRGQTPQTFRYGLILEAHRKAEREGVANASDDCRLALAMGARVAVVQGSEKNWKITTEWDLKMAEKLFAAGGEVVEKREEDDDGANQEGGIEVPSGQRTGG